MNMFLAVVHSSDRLSTQLEQSKLSWAKQRYTKKRFNDYLEAAQETTTHANRVAQIAHKIAIQYSFSLKELFSLALAARLHDFGKFNIPTRILLSHSQLNLKDRAIIEEHPKSGCAELIHLGITLNSTHTIFQHHERMDGSGYPLGLRGSDISLPARILAVADTYDVLTNKRPYKKAHTATKALTIMEQDKKVFDPQVLDTLKRTVLESKEEKPTHPASFSLNPHCARIMQFKQSGLRALQT